MVRAQNITISNDIDSALIGGNAATEATEEDEGVDSSAVTGINVVISHRLQETAFDKASYMAYIKDYMKAIKEKLQKTNPARVDAFVAGAQTVVKRLIGQISKGEIRFFTGVRILSFSLCYYNDSRGSFRCYYRRA